MLKKLFFVLLCVDSFYTQNLQPREFRNSKLTFKTNDSLTLDIKDDEVKFFFIADQGGIGSEPFYTPILTYVSRLMAKLAKEHNTQFQFAMGDNFYFDGVQSVNDSRFKTSFENVFNDTHLINTPWFLSLGNHDYRGKVEANPYAQIDYTRKSKRWILPSFLYDLDIVLNNELIIKTIVIDTQLICDEGSDGDREAYLNKVIKKIEEHSTTNAYYYLVLGHYPLWSIGELGPNKCMIDKLRPSLHKYKVDGYFTGHEHAMQHFRDTYMDHTIDFMVAGASNFVIDKPINKDKIDHKILKFFWETNQNQTISCVDCSGAIVLVKANKKQMSLRLIDTKENEIYSFSIPARRTQNIGNSASASKSLITLYFVNLFLVLIFLMLH